MKSGEPCKHSSTPCWSCVHSVPRKNDSGEYVTGCDWSLYKCKVPGWTAKEHRIVFKVNHKGYKDYVSFDVIKCPKFKEG